MMPVVDIFAGAGGLSEGFARAGFKIALSCEKEETFCETLKIRHFVNNFNKKNIPKDYYDFLKGKISLDELTTKFPKEFKNSSKSVICHTMGRKSNKLLHDKINQNIGFNKNFVLLGGPPCQAYSIAGRSRSLGSGNLGKNKEDLAKSFYKDERHLLYLEYLEVIAFHRPAIFVMENVKGLMSAKTDNDATNGAIFNNILNGLCKPSHIMNELGTFKDHNNNELKEVSYKIYNLKDDAQLSLPMGFQENDYRQFLLDSSHYGVPQKRERVFIVGVREDIRWENTYLKKLRANTVRNAIQNLPKLRSGLSKKEDNYQNWFNEIKTKFEETFSDDLHEYKFLNENIEKINSNMSHLERGSKFIEDKKIFKEKSKLLKFLEDPKINGWIQHESRSHLTEDIIRYFYCSSLSILNGYSPKIDEWKGNLQKLKPKHKNVTLSNGKLSTKVHVDRFKTQVWDKPSSTITSHISKDGHYFIHPDPCQARSLTVREAARLQTFPDNFFFYGNKTKQYIQVGNAVPPYLSFQIANKIKKIVKAQKI